jgi:hypothetical protein
MLVEVPVKQRRGRPSVPVLIQTLNIIQVCEGPGGAATATIEMIGGVKLVVAKDYATLRSELAAAKD